MSGTTPSPAPGAVKFEEAIDFLRAKLGRLMPSNTYTDTAGRVNSVGWAVAGAWKDALLRDLHAAVLEAADKGITPAKFQKTFEAIAARHQWSYRGDPAWRARTILETNLRSAYQAGHWQQAVRLKDARPYLRYVAVLDTHTRPMHRAWHGIILPVDHPWWRTHFPPNGWGCRCTVQSLSQRDLDRKGWTVTPDDEVPAIDMQDRQVGTLGTKSVPAGIDPGFEHNPGLVLEDPFVPQLADDLMNGLVAPIARNAARQEVTGQRTPPLEGNVPPMPPARILDPARLLPPDTGDETAIAAFLAEFGSIEGEPVIWQDRAGGAIGIGRRMFETKSGALKVGKESRKEYLRLLADAMHDPDEVWVALEGMGADRVLPDGTRQTTRLVMRRRYVLRFATPQGEVSGVAAFEWDGASWQGKTIFAAKVGEAPSLQQQYLDERARFGVRIYAKGEEAGG